MKNSEIGFSYETTKRAVNEAPMTWLPALFILIVKRCIEEKVFNKGAMTKYVREESRKNDQ